MKRRLLACLTLLCMLAMTIVPVAQADNAATASDLNTVTPAPSAEVTAAPTDVPATEVPATDIPAMDIPATDAPATDAPAADTPAADVPASEVPAADVPATDVPATEVPAVERESSDVWARSVSGAALTGDWANDIVAVAATQLGYAEQNGYVRYAAWYGESADQEWSAMFVGFVLKYAGIPKNDYPYAATPSGTMSAIDNMGAYVRGDYAPKAGDLVFFSNSSEAQHVGIVEQVSGDITTIEGDVDGQVARLSYALNDASIIGYADTAKLVELAKVENVMPDDVPAIAEGGETAYLCASDVNMRAEPTTDSERVGRVKKYGSELLVTGAVKNDKGEIWYAVTYDGVSGYIRGDFVTLSKPAATKAPEVTEEPVVVEEEPVVTDEPVVTEETVVTDEPVVTDAPVVTEKPIVTETTVVTDEPVVTEIPAESGTIITTITDIPAIVTEIPAEPSDAPVALLAVAQPVSGAYQGGESAAFTFVAEGAVAYTWQMDAVGESGERVWMDVPDATGAELTIPTTVDALKHTYRCVAADAAGNTLVSEEAVALSAEYMTWLNTAEVTEAMLIRALNAGSLDALVLEGDVLVYVRTGEVYANYDASTGYLTDCATGLTIAYVDAATGTICPVTAE